MHNPFAAVDRRGKALFPPYRSATADLNRYAHYDEDNKEK